MSWITCPYCGEKNNGGYRDLAHQRANHPAEKALADAQDKVRVLEDTMDRANQDIAAWADYKAALALPGLPPFTRKLVEQQMKSWAFIPQEGLTTEEHLGLYLQSAEARLSGARAALAVLNPVAG